MIYDLLMGSEIIMYHTEDDQTKIETTFDGDTVWLSINQMAELFQRDKSTISRHIKNIFNEGELIRNSVVANFATAATDGKHMSKLIPLMIYNCLKEEALPVYGDSLQIRDWLYVSDHCSAIDTVLHKGVNGEIYNIGGNNEKANIEIVKLIIKTLGKSEDLIKYVKDRPGHDRRYAIDNTKISTELGWSPAYTFEQGMSETIDWYINNTEWINNVVSRDYMKYYDEMYSGIDE